MRELVLAGTVLGLVALSGAAMADPATGTSAPASQASPAAPADNNLDRVVCKTNAAPTGTRLGATHTCHTEREWERERQEEQNHLTEMQIQRGNGPAGP